MMGDMEPTNDASFESLFFFFVKSHTDVINTFFYPAL